MKRFLCTTALEETWREGEPTLFLGEWCLRYSRKDRWQRMDAEVLPYHWDDRGRYYSDFLYLRDLHERLLRDLAVQLNQIHGVDRSQRYWRIVIAPWLGNFVAALFDRWTSVQQAVDRYQLSGTLVLTGREESFVPSDMSDFDKLYGTDAWNHSIYALILRRFSTVPCIEREWTTADEIANIRSATRWRQRIRGTLATWYDRVAGAMTREQDVFLLTTYLPVRDEWKLCRRLGQAPLRRRSPRLLPSTVIGSWRQWVVTGENHSEFEKCARALIPQQIPTAYLKVTAGSRNKLRACPGRGGRS